MSRKGIIIVASGIAAALLLATVYVAFRPGAAASRAEIDKVLDPMLLKREPRNVANSVRAKDFEKILSLIKAPKVNAAEATPAEITTAAQDFEKANAGPLLKLKQIVDDGPLQFRVRGFLGSEIDHGMRLRVLAHGLALLISDRRRPVADRLAALELGEMTAFRTLQGARTTLSSMVAESALLNVERAGQNLVDTTRLSDEQLEVFAKALPDIDSVADIEPQIVGDFQSQIYGFLPYPSIVLPKSPPEERDFVPASYDPILTAQECNKVCREAIRVSRLPLIALSTPEYDRISKLSDSVPLTGSGGKKGLALWWRKQVYRYESSKIRNALGYFLLPTGLSDMKVVLPLRAEALSSHRVLQLRLQCESFVRRKHAVPKSLDELVKAGMIRSVPLDAFNLRPIKYDSSRRLIWSIGVNKIDDNGAKLPIVNLRPPDISLQFRAE